jgi:hypothetical protein
MLNILHKEKILKVAKQKQQVTFKDKSIKISTQTLNASRA